MHQAIGKSRDNDPYDRRNNESDEEDIDQGPVARSMVSVNQRLIP